MAPVGDCNRTRRSGGNKFNFVGMINGARWGLQQFQHHCDFWSEILVGMINGARWGLQLCSCPAALVEKILVGMINGARWGLQPVIVNSDLLVVYVGMINGARWGLQRTDYDNHKKGSFPLE